MSRGVLGNDPFRRGAAARPEAETGEAKPPSKSAPKKRGAKARKPASPEARSAGTAAPTAGTAKAPGRAAGPSRTPQRKGGGSAAGPSTPRKRTSPIPTEPGAEASGAPRKDASAATGVAPSKPAGVKRAGSRRTSPVADQKPAATALPPSGAPAPETPSTQRRASTRHLTPVASPSPATRPPPIAPAVPEAAQVADVVSLPPRAPATSRPGAPHLMLVSEVEPPVEPPQPRFPRDEDDLATRATRALEFARDLAAAGLQGPTLTRSARVGRGLIRAALSGVGSLWGQQVDPYGRDPRLVEDLEPLAKLLYTHYWRVTVQGAVHVPEGPVLLVANHAGVMPFDGPVLQQVLTRERPDLNEARWLVEDQIFHAPFFGTLFNRLGALRACPQNARRLLSEQRPVIVFPEGAQGLGKPYRERGQLKRFGRGGFVKIALRARVPIVPVAIVGSEETSPLMARLPGSIFGLGYIPVTPLGPLPLPARWMVRFGEPLNLDGAGPDDADNLPVVQRLSERTRDSIQGMREALLRERGGAWFG